MIRLLISAPASGSGKTIVTCALLTAFQRRGLSPCAFKCGPDYIDPMFHRAVIGVESHNLDLFLSDAARVRSLFARAIRNHGAAVCEGAMGFYDGMGAITDQNSAYQIADTLDLPVLLVVRAKGAALSLAALIRGMREFREDSHIAGVLLNDCPPALCKTLAPVLEAESGVPVLGCLPRIPEAEIKSRHLGLYTAPEIHDLRERFALLADTLENNVDMDRLLELYNGKEDTTTLPPPAKEGGRGGGSKIAVARDAAFCFTYAETLETLETCGAEIVFFSPLRDRALPDGVSGLYLPGGYPELYAKMLSENTSMRSAIAAAVRDGMPAVAECGGFLYLCAALRDKDGVSYPMAGILPGEGFPAGRLIRFGYAAMTAETDSLLFRAGERIPVHEFHHWDSTDSGTAFQIAKPLWQANQAERVWRGGFAHDSLYAGFPHLYMAGRPELAERFVNAT